MTGGDRNCRIVRKITDGFRRKIRKSWGWQPDLGNGTAAPNYWVTTKTRQTVKMRFLRHSLTGLFLTAVTLGLLGWAGVLIRDAVAISLARDSAAPPARERTFTVPVMTVAAGTVTPRLSAFGQVQSTRTLELRAAVGGQVIELAPAFVEGGQVTVGQVLLRLDPADAQDALARARAELSDAESEVRDAARGLTLARADLAAAEAQSELRQRALQRQQDLATRGFGSDAAIETSDLAASAARQSTLSRAQAEAQAEARGDQAATRLARIRIALAEAERRLTDTTITAPFDGTLTGVTLVEGRLVTANERLAALVDGMALEVAFRLSTAQYVRLLDAQGQLVTRPATVALDLWGAELTSPARLTRASAAVGEGLTGRLVFATIDVPLGLQPGDFVTVSVEEPPLQGIIAVPATALDAANTVLVLGPEDRLEAVPVTLERRQGDLVLLRAPELEGREVVSERTPLIGPGIRIKPLRAPDPQDPDAQANAAPAGPQMVELTPERRARLVAYVTDNSRMPADVRTRLLTQLQDAQVPLQVVERLESRMGG